MVAPEAEPWEQTLREGFPGWLLPEASRTTLDATEAARFLTRLSGRRDHLALLRATSLLVAQRETLDRFLLRELPALIRGLPARTRVEQRTWEGGYQGRLDIQATQRLHHAGEVTRFVTRSRHRDFALPENLLVKRVCVRLEAAFRTVLSGSANPTGWLKVLAEQARALRLLLLGTVLREVPDEPRLSEFHRVAARRAPHAAYGTAARLELAVRLGLDDSSPERIARVLAEGALWPLEAPKRFELAVLLRLLGRLAERLRVEDPASPWSLEHALIQSGRDEVATFHRSDGAWLRLWYDTAPTGLRPGRRHRVVGHYLRSSQQRPDITLCRHQPDGRETWAVVEIKHTFKNSYIAQGIGEALLYELEYGDQLGGWPKALVVVPGDIEPPPLEGDTVVVEGWPRWVSPDILEGLLDGLIATS